ncbi:MAG: hypothetical protein V4596_09650 [Bdellovibrionota bacterium]
MKEAQIRSVALFFFYTFLDKSLALKASVEALGLYDKRLKRRETHGPTEPLLVYSTYKVWKKYSKKRNIKATDFDLLAEGWIIPPTLKLEPWREFVKDIDPQLYLAVIWSQLLNFSDKDISEGLGVTEGSIRYRVGKGLKILGEIVPPGGGFDA